MAADMLNPPSAVTGPCGARHTPRLGNSSKRWAQTIVHAGASSSGALRDDRRVKVLVAICCRRRRARRWGTMMARVVEKTMMCMQIVYWGRCKPKVRPLSWSPSMIFETYTTSASLLVPSGSNNGNTLQNTSMSPKVPLERN